MTFEYKADSALSLVFENTDMASFDWDFVNHFEMQHTYTDVVKIDGGLLSLNCFEGCTIEIGAEMNAQFLQFGTEPSGISTFDWIAAHQEDIVSIVVATAERETIYQIDDDMPREVYRDNGSLIVSFG